MKLLVIPEISKIDTSLHRNYLIELINKENISALVLLGSLFLPDQEKSEKNNDSARKIIAFSILGWVVTGYAFFTLIVFGNPISNSFFSSDNPVDPHY